jgi:hypothetical protein
MSAPKPTATLSLDLDNRWSYLKTHGDSSWQSFPSYLEVVVPRVLEFLKERGLTITFFVVGQDAALEKNAEPLAALSGAGHEIGNHSFHHQPWLHLYSEEEIDRELAMAEEEIEAVAGRKPVGFRGPGFSLSRSTLRCLARRGYLYDASTFPTFLGPLARAYYFMTARLSKEELRQRKALFGEFRDGLQPIKPYRWRLEEGRLLEIPVTTMPLFRVPVHASYVLYLSGFSRPLARLYFRTALELCRLSGQSPSLLLHPLDFLGKDDGLSDLSFFPAMGQPSGRKLEMMAYLIDTFSSLFRVVTMEERARELAADESLPLREPVFRDASVPPSPKVEVGRS